jgi:hypothetical protein
MYDNRRGMQTVRENITILFSHDHNGMCISNVIAF